MTSRHHSDSIVIARSPEDLYDMVSDVTRMGEWSPICAACWWDEGGGPRAGAWFTGRNETAERTWETRSLVEVADRGREFTFAVFGSRVRWSYTFEAAEGGTGSPSPGTSSPTGSPASTSATARTPRPR